MSGFAADFIKPYSRGGEAGKWTPLQPSGQRPVKPENLSPTDYPTNTLDTSARTYYFPGGVFYADQTI